MRLLITGICGFVGSSLARTLQESIEGVTIIGIDNLTRPGSETNRRALREAGIEVIHGDIRAASDVSALPKADWVIDAAANPSVRAGIDGQSSPRQLIEGNLWGTVEILEYCRMHGAGLILLSTSRVYSIEALVVVPLRVDDQAFVPDATQSLPRGLSAEGVGVDFSTAAPVSLYGSTKIASELLAMEYAATFQFPLWINRCGILAGAGQFGTPDQGIVAYWLNAHRRRRPLRYIGFEGRGYQSRDAMHPRDLAALLVAQIKTTRKDGRRLYVASGGASRLFSLARLTRWCDSRFGALPVEPDTRPRAFDIPWFAGDSTLATQDFGWTPSVSLDGILDDIAQHAESHPDWLATSGIR